jgi:predicted transcriptional regulator of viral defense system
MPRTARHSSRPASVSRAERAFLTEKERRRERGVALREDRDLLAEYSADPYGMVHRMAAKGLLLPLASGSYLIAPPSGAQRLQQAGPIQLTLDARLAPHGEYFISYFTGLIEHRLTDLDEATLYVAFRGANLRNVEVAGRPVHLAGIKAARKWFGIETLVTRDGQRGPRYRRATLERVLLDTLDKPRLCGSPEVVVRGWERALRERNPDLQWLLAHAPEMGYSVVRRLGFWLEQLGEARRAQCLRGQLGNRSVPILLDSSRRYGDGDWPVNRDWSVVVNIPRQAFTGWIDYGK